MLELEKCWTELSDFIKNNKEQIKKEVKKAFNDDHRIFITVQNISNLDVYVKQGRNYNPSILNIDFVDGVQEGKGKIYKQDNVFNFLATHENQYINRTRIQYYSVFNLRNNIHHYSSYDTWYINYNGVRIDTAKLHHSLCFSYRIYYNDVNISFEEVGKKEISYHRYICKTITEKLPKGYYVAKLLILAKRFSFLLQAFKKVVSQTPLDFLNSVPSRYLIQESMFDYPINSFLQQSFKTIRTKSFAHNPSSVEFYFAMEEECASDVERNHICLSVTDPDKRILYTIHLVIPEEEAEQRLFLGAINILCKDINYD